MKKKLMALVAMALVLTACGSDDSSKASSTPEESTTTTTTTTTAAETTTTTTTTTEEEILEGPITLIGNEEYAGSWEAIQFLGDEGFYEGYVDNKYFKPYLETGCSLTFELQYKTLPPEGKFLDYYLFAPCSCKESWPKLYTTDPSYIVGIVDEATGRVEVGKDVPKAYADGTPMYNYFMQTDGFIVLTPNADGEWKTETCTFNVSAECLQYLVDTATVNPDGTLYGGMVFQSHGVYVKSLVIDEPKDLTDNGLNPDPAA